MVVYKIENTKDCKIYIGSTNNFERRKKGHINKLNRNEHRNPRLQRAWNKYGSENFKFKIIEEVKENLLEREQYYIDILKPYDKKIGYNILKDVGWTWSGSRHSSKTIKKMKNSKLSIKNPMYGKGRTIQQFDLDGNLINEFISRRQAAEYLKLKQKIKKKINRNDRKIFITSALCRCLKGNRPTAYGYKWSYKPI